MPPITFSNNGGSTPGVQRLFLSTPSNDVKYTIRIGGEDGSVFETGTVSNDSPVEVTISDQPTGGNTAWSNAIVNPNEVEIPITKGFYVEADSEIYVSLRFIASGESQAGAIVSKGVSALGTRFRAGMLQNQSSNHLGFISVMATENNSTINFDLFDGVETTGGQNDHSITLDKNQSYIIANQNSNNSLIGTLVTSDKPIVVNTGAYGSFDSSTGGQDYGVDQIVESSLVGSEYIFIKGIASNNIETVLIIADQDNTKVNVNGDFYDEIINAGDFLILKGNSFNADGNLYVSTDNADDKLFAYQGTGKNYTFALGGSKSGHVLCSST